MHKGVCVVFWLENRRPMSKEFVDMPITIAVNFCGELRKRIQAGEVLSHVCMVSESVNNLTLAGVSDELPPGYDWMMRRKPFTPGRPSGGK